MSSIDTPVTAPADQSNDQPSDIDALVDVANTAVTLANDTQSAFASKGATAAQLLEVIPQIIKVAGEGKEVPEEAKHLSESDLNKLVDVVGSGIKLPEGKATSIAKAIVPLAHAAIGLFEKVVGLSKAIAESKADA